VRAPDIAAVVFGVSFAGREHLVDLSGWPCPALVGPLAVALRECATGNRCSSWSSYRPTVAAAGGFVAHVATVEQHRAATFGFGDLRAGHVDGFEESLVSRWGQEHLAPNQVMARVVRVLRLAGGYHRGGCDPDFLGRIRFATRQARVGTHPALDAYPTPVFEAIRNAATADVREISRRIARGEQLAAAGQDPDVAGWDRLENVLWRIDRHGPLVMADRRGHQSAVRALGGVEALNRWLYLSARDVVPLLVLLVCLTGLEPECAKGLRVDCLVNPAGGFVSIRYVKRRAGAQAAKTLRVADGGALHHPGALIRLIGRLTRRARQRAGTDALWVHACRGVHPTFAGLNHTHQHVAGWLARHGLEGRLAACGPAGMDLRRLRKSYKSQQYLKAAGVLADFTQGHSTQVAARHYAGIPVHREVHDQAVEAGLREALAVALAPAVVLDDDGRRLDDSAEQLAPQEVAHSLAGASDVFLASCRDYYHTPFAAAGRPCPVPLWGCLECPNAVFTTRHLPALLSFVDFMHHQRDELAAPEWNLRYGLAWQRLTAGVIDRFSAEQIRLARAVAESGQALLLLPPQLAAR
jgi:hypothetical protein